MRHTLGQRPEPLARNAQAVAPLEHIPLVALGREALRNPNWAVQAAVELAGPEAYERYWQPRWGWWLVRRATSLARRGAGD